MQSSRPISWPSARLFTEAIQCPAVCFAQPELRDTIPAVDKLGMPLVKNALAFMECQTVKIYEGGDHLIFLGEVDNAEVLQPDHPLIYFRGKYRKVHVDL